MSEGLMAWSDRTGDEKPELRRRADDARVTLLENRLDAHERICAERQGSIKGRLTRIEAILVTATGALILVLWQLWTHQVHLP